MTVKEVVVAYLKTQYPGICLEGLGGKNGEEFHHHDQ
jgi:hypothetical protein